MAPLFNTDHCSLPSVASGGFQFIPDCLVLPPPPLLFDCPDIEIPFDPPPIPPPPIPCPQIDVKGSLTVTDVGPAKLTITTTRSQASNACDILIDFNFDLPLPKIVCPTISATGMLHAAIGTKAELLINTTQLHPASSMSGSVNACKFLIDFDLKVPLICPEIQVSARGSWGKWHVPITVGTITEPIIYRFPSDSSKSPACHTLLEFNFDFPKIPPPPCPTFVATAAVGMAGDAPATFDVTTGVVSASSICHILLDMNLELPCPQFETSLTMTRSAGSGTFTVTPTGTDPCSFLFDLNLDFNELLNLIEKLNANACRPKIKAKPSVMMQRSLSTRAKYSMWIYSSPGCSYKVKSLLQLPKVRSTSSSIQVVTDVSCSAGNLVICTRHIKLPRHPIIRAQHCGHH